jgi:uncharacterized coiled-coil protein SlyX
MDEDLKRHMDILAEAADRKIDRILEVLSLLDEKVDRHQTENRQEFAETRSMIKLSYTSLDQRLTTLESRVERIEAILFSEDRQ